ncbi:hypothetical protein FE257_000763 [Aspergillus nanangensis]|uniref:Cytochrome P450 n=1 Tax=Aspergillus nanangensis TaxID=2582783 RepID=A0AAD4CG38_ASPNN|nr:hypothetical protein FE257_000763 [Aspergillus nanangensis]
MSTALATMYASTAYQQLTGMKQTCTRISLPLEDASTSIFEAAGGKQSFVGSTHPSLDSDHQLDRQKLQPGFSSKYGDVSITSTIWVAVVIVMYMVLLLSRIFRSPIWRIPGPKVTAFTRIYEFYYNALKANTYSYRILALHQSYGPIVRVNPNEVHIDDPDFGLHFGTNLLKQKDPWYYNTRVSSATAIVTELEYHKLRRTTEAAELVPRLMGQGPAVIQTKSKLLCRRLRQYARHRAPVNLSNGFRSIARDCLSIIFTGTCNELLVQEDLGHQDLIWSRGVFRYLALTRQLPSLVGLEKYLPARAFQYFFPLLYAKQRLERFVTGRVREGSLSDGSKCFAQGVASGKTPVDLNGVVDEVVGSFVAGSEAIGHSLTHIAYHLMQQPGLVAQLREELERNGFDTGISPRQIHRRFPLLVEGFRTQRGNTFRFPRVAEQDMEYSGYFIPAGTVISMTPLDTNLNHEIFPNPDIFQPTRWLGPECDKLDRYLSTFGYGSRKCLAATFNVMMIEYVLAFTVSQFDIAPLHDQVEWPQDGSLEMFPPHSALGLMAHVSLA